MKIFRLLLIFVVCFVLGNALAGADSLPRHFAYVLRFDKDGRDSLIKFDIDKDEIAEEILLPRDHAFNNFVVDESGGCYIADYRYADRFGRNIYYYNSGIKKIEHIVDLKDVFGPRYMAATKDKLIVEIKGSDSSNGVSGILFVDRNSNIITNRIYVGSNEASQININDIYFDGNKYLFFTTIDYSNSKNVRFRSGEIFIVDVKKAAIYHKIMIPGEYKFNDGIFCYGDKVFVATLGLYDLKMPDKLTGDTVGINNEILVFSLSSGRLINKILVDYQPFKFAYDPSVKKLYVHHMTCSKSNGDIVEIIDVNTDKIIGKLNIPSALMLSVVKPGKIYITVGNMFLSPKKTEPGLLVLDTKTDKIIKRLNGNYKGISVNNFIN